MGDLELTDHLDGAICGFRGRGGEAGEHGPSGVLGVEGVGFAVRSSCAAIGTACLDDFVAMTAQEGGQGGSVGTGALDAEREDLAKVCRPVQ